MGLIGLFNLLHQLLVERSVTALPHPFGVFLSAFLFGALDGGASRMQFESGVPADIIAVIQALVLAFVAAPTLIRQLYRIQKPKDEIETTTTVSWGA